MRSIRRMWMRGSLAVVTTALVILASACSSEEDDASPPRGSPQADTSSETTPDRLADGSSLPELPSAVTSAFERPIVGADSVGPDHPLAEACLALEQESASPEPFEGSFAGGYLSPYGGGVQFEVRASTSGEDPGKAMTTCDAVWRSGEPRPGAGALHPWSDDDALRSAGGALFFSGGVAFLSALAPDHAAWLVHDHGNYLIAYPVTDRLPVRVTTPVERTTDTLAISVVYLDESGERIGTDEVMGVVAG